MRDRDKNAGWGGTAEWDQNSGGMRDLGSLIHFNVHFLVSK